MELQALLVMVLDLLDGGEKIKNTWIMYVFSFHSEFSKPNKFLNVIKEVNGEFRTHVNIIDEP